MEKVNGKLNWIMAVGLPPLAGAYTALNFLETNLASLRVTDILLITGGLVLFGFAVLAAYRATGLSLIKSSLIATVTVLFCVYGFNLFLLFRAATGTRPSLLTFSFIVAILFGLLFLFLYRSKGGFTIFLQLLTTIFVVGTIASISKISLYEINRLDASDVIVEINGATKEDLSSPAEKRNIFYIVMDRYASNRTLNSDYNFDNSDFTNTLRSHGFFVANNSIANYPFTYQSLSSSMNMTYHKAALAQTGKNQNDRVPFIRLIENNRVTELLKDKGYKYIHMGSWWAPTETSPLADENFRTSQLGRIELRFLRRSIVAQLLSSSYEKKAKDSIAPIQCDRVPRKFDRLKELAKTEQSVFVFAHFLLPHDPFVFGKDGNCKGIKEVSTNSLEQNYLGQLQYANAMLTELLSSLLSGPGPKPIIIIQADEGPYPTRFREDEDAFQWSTASDAEMQQKMRILNAYYFPDTEKNMFYDTITPVNSFRLMFNAYFQGNLELLPDLSFAIPNNDNIYGFFDVTDTVQ